MSNEIKLVIALRLALNDLQEGGDPEHILAELLACLTAVGYPSSELVCTDAYRKAMEFLHDHPV